MTKASVTVRGLPQWTENKLQPKGAKHKILRLFLLTLNKIPVTPEVIPDVWDRESWNGKSGMEEYQWTSDSYLTVN